MGSLKKRIAKRALSLIQTGLSMALGKFCPLGSTLPLASRLDIELLRVDLDEQTENIAKPDNNMIVNSFSNLFPIVTRFEQGSFIVSLEEGGLFVRI